MKPKLSLKVRTGSPRNGLSMDVTSEPIQYCVVGMPPGDVAEIGLYPDPNKWSIYRRTGGDKGEWKGSCGTKEEALAALETEVDAS